jgi:hypothetical protein
MVKCPAVHYRMSGSACQRLHRSMRAVVLLLRPLNLLPGPDQPKPVSKELLTIRILPTHHHDPTPKHTNSAHSAHDPCTYSFYGLAAFAVLCRGAIVGNFGRRCLSTSLGVYRSIVQSLPFLIPTCFLPALRHAASC